MKVGVLLDKVAFIRKTKDTCKAKVTEVHDQEIIKLGL